MARTPPRVAADGLPEPLPVRPVLKPLAMALGAVAGIAIVLFLQQSGSLLLTTGWIAAGLLGGLVLGVALPSIPYVLAARHVNSVVADERKKRSQAGAAPSSAAASQAPSQGAT